MPRKVLVVEDDDLVRTVLRKAFENSGYHVSEAADGAEALRAVEATPFDLVVTDILMPEKDGLETIAQIRKQQRDIPVIAITGAQDPHYLVNAAGLGAARVLTKPFPPGQLVGIAEELLNTTPA